jgi:hypothetical protein
MFEPLSGSSLLLILDPLDDRLSLYDELCPILARQLGGHLDHYSGPPKPANPPQTSGAESNYAPSSVTELP